MALVPPVVATRTSTVPEPAGAEAVQVLALQATPVAGVAPKATVPALRLDPPMVTCVPPAAGRVAQSLATVVPWPARDEGQVARHTAPMTARMKTGVVLLVTLWTVQVVVVLPVMWVGGAGSSALVGAAVFAGIVAAAIVGIPAVVAEGRRRRQAR